MFRSSRVRWHRTSRPGARPPAEGLLLTDADPGRERLQARQAGEEGRKTFGNFPGTFGVTAFRPGTIKPDGDRQARPQRQDMRKLIVMTVGLLLAACAAVPRVNDTPSPEAAHIVGSRGPLTAEQSRALLDRIAPEPGDAGMLKRHTAIEEAVAETPLVAGNTTRILIDGRETFAAMFAAMRAARTSINLEYYILEDVESDGLRLSDLLVSKRQQGVAVNIIYDSFGSGGTPADFFRRLRDAGAQIVDYNPLNPVTFNFRDHRKILVVDGEKAIVGGINLSTSYQSLAGSGGAGGKTAPTWRDTDLEIEGPVVAQLQTLFVQHWEQQKGPPLERAGFFPAAAVAGREVVRIVGSTPDEKLPRFYATLLSAI